MKLHHIQPRKPTQNAYIERFNRTFRNEVLDTYMFEDLAEVRDNAWEWIPDDEPDLNWFKQERKAAGGNSRQYDHSPAWKLTELPLEDGRLLVLDDSWLRRKEFENNRCQSTSLT